MAVEVSTEHYTKVIAGKEYDVTVTRRVGLDTQIIDGEAVLVDEATFIDYGPKLGVTRCYIRHEEVEPTPEERADGRRRIQATVAQAMVQQGIW